MTSIKEVQALVCPPIGVQVDANSLGVANTTNYVNIFNFKVPNWIEGGKSLQQLQIELLNKGLNWTLCPADKPFLINGSTTCEQCPSNFPIYNLSSTLCVNCPYGQTFSSVQQKCVSTLCSNGKYYNYDAKTCLCPQSQPFEDASGVCFSCQFPKFYNKLTKSCDSCPTGYFYDITRNSCAPCPADKPFSSGISCFGCYNGFVYDEVSKSCKCPPSKSYTDGVSCFECYMPKFWNTATLRC